MKQATKPIAVITNMLKTLIKRDYSLKQDESNDVQKHPS
jgi:hypothetical protein